MSQRPDTPILDQVQTPADLKRFSDEELKLLAEELRNELIAWDPLNPCTGTLERLHANGLLISILVLAPSKSSI